MQLGLGEHFFIVPHISPLNCVTAMSSSFNLSLSVPVILCHMVQLISTCHPLCTPITPKIDLMGDSLAPIGQCLMYRPTYTTMPSLPPVSMIVSPTLPLIEIYPSTFIYSRHATTPNLKITKSSSGMMRVLEIFQLLYMSLFWGNIIWSQLPSIHYTRAAPASGYIQLGTVRQLYCCLLDESQITDFTICISEVGCLAKVMNIGKSDLLQVWYRNISIFLLSFQLPCTGS